MEGITMRSVIRVKFMGLTLLLSCYVTQGFSADLQNSNLFLASKSATKSVDVRNFNQAISLYSLGLKYLNGKDVSKNNLKALHLFRKAAEQGYPRAEYQLGIMYRDGIGVGRNKKTAIKLFRHASVWGESDAKSALDQLNGNNKPSKGTDGDGGALYRRAKKYLSGNSNKEDFNHAYRLLIKSARLNHRESQYEVGILYKNGTGTPKNIEKAKYWLTKAVDNGYVIARVALRKLLSHEAGHKNKKFKAINGQYNFSADSVYVAAAKKGNVNAQYKLGLMYIMGDVIERNPSEGLLWLRRAAKHNHLDAQLKLGDMLYKGIQLDQDYAEAAKWYYKAAKQGDASAQYVLANMYKKGIGLDKNRRKAEIWYRKAAKQGHAKAKDKISRL